MPPPFLQPSCVLRSRFEAVVKRSEKVKLHTDIKDKVVIISGASSGIGEATEVMLAQRGAKVVLGARSFRRGIDSNVFETLRQNSFIQ